MEIVKILIKAGANLNLPDKVSTYHSHIRRNYCNKYIFLRTDGLVTFAWSYVQSSHGNGADARVCWCQDQCRGQGILSPLFCSILHSFLVLYIFLLYSNFTWCRKGTHRCTVPHEMGPTMLFARYWTSAQTKELVTMYTLSFLLILFLYLILELNFGCFGL